jgi:hypothetical protein
VRTKERSEDEDSDGPRALVESSEDEITTNHKYDPGDSDDERRRKAIARMFRNRQTPTNVAAIIINATNTNVIFDATIKPPATAISTTDTLPLTTPSTPPIQFTPPAPITESTTLPTTTTLSLCAPNAPHLQPDGSILLSSNEEDQVVDCAVGNDDIDDETCVAMSDEVGTDSDVYSDIENALPCVKSSPRANSNRKPRP